MNAEIPLRAVLVDDEPPARALLRDYLDLEEGVELVAECANGFEAVKQVGDLKPDLVFLDIQMPKLDGFEVLDLLDPGPLVIFVTAYDEHALRAFEVNAVDYLLKPYSRQRLQEALVRARERLQRTPPPEPVSASKLAAAARPPGQYAARVLVKDGAQVTVIPTHKIDLVEAQDDYISIHSEGQRYLKTQTLSELEESLDPTRFVRVHRSYLLNVERIARIEPYGKDSRVAILKDERAIPVSRSGYARLKEQM